MCVRTKTSYGCGCVYKDTNECQSSRCSGMERYHYLKEGDCRTCKTGGGTVTRGREGKGRYAREIEKRHSPVADEPVSPWADQTKPARHEKEWQSPTRQQADMGWEEEHSRRMDDLQARAEKMSITSQSRRGRSPSSEEDTLIDHSEHDSGSDHPSRHRTSRKLFAEVSRPENDHHSNSHRRREPRPLRDHNDRSDSYESLGSYTPRATPSTARSQSYKYPDPSDPYDSGYGSHSSYKSHHAYSNHPRPGLAHSQSAGLYGYGAKTEPYNYGYTPSPRTVYEVPVTTGYGYPAGTYELEMLPDGQARLVSRRY